MRLTYICIFALFSTVSLFAAADDDKQLLSLHASAMNLAARNYVNALLDSVFGYPEEHDSEWLKKRLPDEIHRGQLHRILAIKNKVASSWTLTQEAIALKIVRWYSGEKVGNFCAENCFPKVFIDDPAFRRQLFLLVNIEDKKLDEVFLAVAKKGLLSDAFFRILINNEGNFDRDLIRPNLEKLKDYDQENFGVSEVVSLLNAQFSPSKQCYQIGQQIDSKKLAAIDKQAIAKKEVESLAGYQQILNDQRLFSILSPEQQKVLGLLVQSQGQSILKLRNMVLNLINENKQKNKKLENDAKLVPIMFFDYDLEDPALKDCSLPYWREQALLQMVRFNLINR